MDRRKFTETEKRNILDIADMNGVTAVLREYRLSYSVFARWKRKYRPEKQDHGPRDAVAEATAELRRLLEENSRLKEIIAHQALKLQEKEEALKKIKKQTS